MDIAYAMQLGVDVFGDNWLEALLSFGFNIIDTPVVRED